MNNKIAVILALADVKYSLNDLEKHYKTFLRGTIHFVCK